MKRLLVYALVDPRDLTVRYVGKSTVGLARPQNHRQECKLSRDPNTHKVNWIRLLVRVGLTYDVVVLDECDSPAELSATERFYISFFRAMGCDLLNRTDGGDGLCGLKHSEETRRRMVLARQRVDGPALRER